MAKEFTLKGIIKFIDDKASATIKKVDEQVSAFKKNTDRIGKGMGQFNQGLTVAAGAGVAVGAGLGLAIKQAADFEQAMANINSVNELTDQQFKDLRQTALRLGASTVFTAKESADAMFELTKAGLTVEQTISAIPGVLSAAAAEEMGLAQAAEIVVGVLQGQNLQMDQSTRVADVLAKTANATASGIIDLGEGFKYANQLSAAGLVTFEDTAAALGILSNAGLKGTIAGTSLVAMFNQITKPSKHVQDAFGGMTGMIETFTDKSTGKLKDLPDLIDIIGQAADQQGNDFMKMAFLSDFVGVEGAKAFSALRRAVTQKDTKGRLMFQGLREDLQNAAGAADDMAKKRLNSLHGVLILIQSAISNTAILFGDIFLPSLREGANAISDFASRASTAMMALSKSATDLTEEDVKLINSPIGQFLLGLKEGVLETIDTVKSAGRTIMSVMEMFGIGGENGAKSLGKFVATAAIGLAIFAPVAAGLIAMNLAFGAMANLIIGPFNILRGLIGLSIQLAGFIPTLVTGLLKFGGAWMTVAKMSLGAIKLMGSGLIWLFTNPIGLTILAIGGLVAAGYFLWKNWGDITGGIKNLWGDFVDYFTGLWTFMATFIQRNSIGEMILKAILLPVRAALTPLAELVQALLKIGVVRKALGEGTATALSGFANTISLLPNQDELNQVRLAQAESASVSAREIGAQRIESQRIVQPTSAEQKVDVSVSQPPINLTIENVTKLDGKELSRSMSKQSVQNSERAGMKPGGAKDRQLATQGQFAPNFAR